MCLFFQNLSTHFKVAEIDTVIWCLISYCQQNLFFLLAFSGGSIDSRKLGKHRRTNIFCSYFQLGFAMLVIAFGGNDEDEIAEFARLLSGLVCSCLMIGISLYQFQVVVVDYSTPALTQFFNIYFPPMYLVFGVIQFFYCFNCIYKSGRGIWRGYGEIRKWCNLFSKNC